MVKNKSVFKKVCLGCGAKNKLVSRCKGCYSLVCVECSINGLCHSCYLNDHVVVEQSLYDADKDLSVEVLRYV